MKKLGIGILACVLSLSAMAADIVLPDPVVIPPTPVAAVTVARVRVKTVTIDIDALQSGGTNAYAILAPYQWVDGSNRVVRTGTARINRADIESTLGAEASTNEIARLMGLVNQIVQGVVK